MILKLQTSRRFVFSSTAHLVYDQPLVLPAHDEEGIECDTELLVGDLGDVLDVDTHVHHRLRLVGQIELGVVLQQIFRYLIDFLPSQLDG